MKDIQIYLIFFLAILNNSSNGQPANNIFDSNNIELFKKTFIPLYSSDSIGLDSLVGDYYLIIYYFNGDCSLCLNEMKKADVFYNKFTNNHLRTIFIVDAINTISFNYHRDRYKISRIVLWDRDKRLRNEAINTCFLVDKFGNLILKGDFIYDEKIKYKFVNFSEHVKCGCN